MFDRKRDFAELPDNKQYTIIDAEVRPGAGLLNFERKDLPQADMVFELRNRRYGFLQIFENHFDKALLRSFAEGHIGFQWNESNTFYLGPHSFALLSYAPTLEASEPHRIIYIPSSTVGNGFDFLQALHEHRKWVQKPIAAAYIGVKVAWDEVKSAIDDLLQDMRDGIGIKSVSEEVFVD
ncbi:hypothetical protein DL765_000930 [Monosporascus sp. GIB2]|nr:hypothetical protein DL765_000930 [Monosporascus sp. GIB2]